MAVSLIQKKIIHFSLIALIIGFFAIVLVALYLHESKIFPH
jgi:hypothetical protein